MRMTLSKLFCVCMLTIMMVCIMIGSGKKTKQVVVSDKLLDAICMVESGCDPEVKDGDSGKAKGQFQIWESYWRDAVEFDKTIGGSYEDVKDKEYAKKIIRAYMQRYAPDKATDEQIARLHNCGPKALKSKYLHLTDKYWEKVQSAYNSMK